MVFVSSDYVRCVAFDPKKPNILASCSNDKTIKIWDIESGACQSTLTGHNAPVTQVEFIDADTVVSSSSDGTTRAWDVATGTQKAEFEGDKFSFTRRSGGDEHQVVLLGHHVLPNSLLVATAALGEG